MKGWKEATLGDLAEVFDCPHSTPMWTSDGYLVIRNYNLVNGKIDISNPSYTDESNYSYRIKRAKPSKGDIILSREAPIGALGFVTGEYDLCLGQRVVLLRPHKIISKYLLYFLMSPDIQNEFRIANGFGSVVSNFRIPYIKKLPIKYPSIREQETITGILSCLDDKIELLDKQNKTLEKIAQTLFKRWFVEFEFPNEEGKPYKSNGGKMVESKLGEIPEGWQTGKLLEILQLSYGKSLKAYKRNSGAYPVVGSSGIVDYHNEYLVEGPGIVVGRKGVAGSVIWIENCFFPIDTTFYVKDLIGVEELYFHFYILKQQNFARLDSDSAVPGLNRNAAYGLEIIIPPKASVKEFNEGVKPIFDKRASNLSQIQTLTRLRDTLLPKLMSGKVRVKY